MTIKTLDDIEFPEFNDTHIKFFTEMIELTKQERLGLVPDAVPFETYMRQYVSLVSKEDEYSWFIEATNAIAAAKHAERVNNQEYSPEAMLRSQPEAKGFNDKELESII